MRLVTLPGKEDRVQHTDNQSFSSASSQPTDSASSDARVRRDGLSEAHAAEPNQLLHVLSIDEYEWLRPQLIPTRLRLKQVLIEPDEPIQFVYFVREGVCSMIATEQEGGDIEVGTIGNEGFVGVPVLLGSETTPYRVFVQVEGDAWRLSVEAFRRMTDERADIRRLLLRYAQHLSDQFAQGVACNRLHTLEERCARWLLMTRDRVHQDEYELTHEFLALMLGVRRAGVTVAMGTLQNAGILRYSRGRVTVLDRRRLEEASCDCYRVIRASHDRLVRNNGNGRA
jgi:CRP-like cAMP-binding protein